jgi:murein DD-endopeptidase MepM/ murein hydrolase activator NlpD
MSTSGLRPKPLAGIPPASPASIPEIYAVNGSLVREFRPLSQKDIYGAYVLRFKQAAAPLFKIQADPEPGDTLVAEKAGYGAARVRIDTRFDTVLNVVLKPSDSITWPLSGTSTPDPIHFPYGPRNIGRYDFHAGVDLYAPRGTRVGAVMKGKVVRVYHYDGTGTAGNNVLIQHDGGLFTAYLHLDTIAVKVGDILPRGGKVGRVGNTGAADYHLHLTYLVGLTGSGIDERKSRNPLELLPHGAPVPPIISFEAGRVVVSLSPDMMTVRFITLYAAGVERTVDYYEVVKEGSTPRDTHVQSGISLDAGRPANGRFPLYVSFQETGLVPTRIVLKDMYGMVLADKRP